MTTISREDIAERVLRGALRDAVLATPLFPRVGVDAVDIDALGHSLAIAGERLVARLFSSDERMFCQGDRDRFATTLAGKEAVAKVLGTGLRTGVTWQHIEILREPSGQPYVRLTGPAEARAKELGLRSLAISLCHEKPLAFAVAVATSGGENHER